jgi:ComF family protein
MHPGRRLFARGSTFVLQLLWPARCAGCDAILGSDAQVMCLLCAPSLVPVSGACRCCALPQLAGPLSRDGRCAGCVRRAPPFSLALAGFEYGEALAAAIVRMKHGDRPDVAGRLGRLLAAPLAVALEPEGGAVDAVVPVPLHARKLRRRGFNQALELARAALARLPVARPSVVLERRLLVRVKDTRELGRWGPAARRAELAGAFAVNRPERVRGRRFLIVDDVMTTGATLDGCARVLAAAGAREVRVLALARAVA